jgi:hypothetical protein
MFWQVRDEPIQCLHTCARFRSFFYFYQILILSVTELISYRPYQIQNLPGTELTNANMIKYQAFHIPNLSDTVLNLSDTTLI